MSFVRGKQKKTRSLSFQKAITSLRCQRRHLSVDLISIVGYSPFLFQLRLLFFRSVSDKLKVPFLSVLYGLQEGSQRNQVFSFHYHKRVQFLFVFRK